MRIEHLESFVVIADTGSFTQAAERLFLTQPVVTRHLAALESELGTKLLARTTRTVNLTEEGRLFLNAARGAVEAVRQGRDDLARAAQRKANLLSVGINYLYMDPVAPLWLKEFQDAETNRNGFIDIVEEQPEALLAALEDKGLDAAFVGLTDLTAIPPTLSYHVILVTDEKIVMARSHPLARRASLTVDDLRSQAFVYPHRGPSLLSSPARRDLEERKIPVEVKYTEFESSALRLVELEGAIIDVPLSCPISGDALVEIPYASPFRIHYCFVWHPERATARIQSLVSFVRGKSQALKAPALQRGPKDQNA